MYFKIIIHVYLIHRFKNHVFQGSKDEIKLRNRKNILVLALTRHDESLMLFHDF